MARLTSKEDSPRETNKHAASARCGVLKCVESLGYDPKPGDLGVGRLKRGESYVEDR